MPAQITLTAKQLQVLADTGQDVIVKEVVTLVTPVEVWLLDEPGLAPDQHRTMIIDQDGEIVSDTVLGDHD